jgi:four helix bundle protein
MGRRTRKDFLRFLVIARGSAKETLYYCMLARDLHFLDEGIADDLIRRYTGLDAGIYAVIDKVGNKK